MGSVLKSKKGSLLDGFHIVAVFFGFAIVVLICWTAFSQINDNFQTQLTDSRGLAIMTESTNSYAGLMDGIFIFLFFGAFLATIVSSLFIDAHPAIFFISILALVILCIIAGILANAYGELETATQLSTYADDFTYIPFIFQYYVQIVIFMICAIAIALYGKSRLG